MDVSGTVNHSAAVRLPERPQEAAEDKERAAKDSEIERRESEKSAEARNERRDAEHAEDRREASARQHRVDIRV